MAASHAMFNIAPVSSCLIFHINSSVAFHYTSLMCRGKTENIEEPIQVVWGGRIVTKEIFKISIGRAVSLVTITPHSITRCYISISFLAHLLTEVRLWVNS